MFHSARTLQHRTKVIVFVRLALLLLVMEMEKNSCKGDAETSPSG